MNAKELAELLKRLEACPAALKWVRGKTLARAWSGCRRADWLLWFAAYVADPRAVTLAACACARTALYAIPEGEPRPLQAIETAERLARGEAGVTERMVRSAAFAVPTDSGPAYASAASAAATGCCTGLIEDEDAFAEYARAAGAFAQAVAGATPIALARIVRQHISTKQIVAAARKTLAELKERGEEEEDE